VNWRATTPLGFIFIKRIDLKEFPDHERLNPKT
jgi:hypothetical protein